MGVKRVIVNIQRLSLGGVAAGDSSAVSTAIRTEMQRLMRAPDVGAAVALKTHTPHVSPGSTRVSSHTSPDRIGTAIARAISRIIS